MMTKQNATIATAKSVDHPASELSTSSGADNDVGSSWPPAVEASSILFILTLIASNGGSIPSLFVSFRD